MTEFDFILLSIPMFFFLIPEIFFEVIGFDEEKITILPFILFWVLLVAIIYVLIVCGEFLFKRCSKKIMALYNRRDG